VAVLARQALAALADRRAAARRAGALMQAIVYLLCAVAVLFSLQSLVLLAYGVPLRFTFGTRNSEPRSLRIVLKVVLQTTLIGSIVLYPYLRGSSLAAYYGARLPWHRAREFLYGEVVALAVLGFVFALELATGGIRWKVRYPAGKALARSSQAALSSLTVVAVEEPLFRGILLQSLLGVLPVWAAIGSSAALFSAAHFIRKTRTYWPAVGLAVLAVWLGVAYYKTQSLWLPMGLHSGGILAIGVHRCFVEYRGRALFVGTQTYPIAGLGAIALMLLGAAVTWSVW
jgi:membrane protease YdiL (CAAX protease family)